MSIATFSEFKLLPAILQAVQECGYTVPTPIQQKAIPLVLAGRDLFGRAPTGTGKTAAFTLPLIQRLASNPITMGPGQVRVLILAPTRELAAQINSDVRNYAKHLPLKTSAVYGGISQKAQVKAVAHGMDILIATPGRLKDLIGQRVVNLRMVEVLVLDEADRMLDMGFIHAVRDIAAITPKTRQTLLFSATFPTAIQKLAANLLRNPETVAAGQDQAKKQALITQSVMFTDRNKKKNLLMRILKDQKRKIGRVLIFSRTKRGANKLAKELTGSGLRADAIHGNKSQPTRQKTLEEFRSGRLKILVATDVMARGIDVDDITHVINFEMPDEAESYVHRIGRTGRAGASGEAISFCDPHERDKLKAIEKLVGRQLPEATEAGPSRGKRGP